MQTLPAHQTDVEELAQVLRETSVPKKTVQNF
ncbi:Uncharacterized protein ChrSV_0007 [Chromobacterium vaccinii]|nr:Uncharacterized protein ChrSW_0007 [Chromobacterium vaccinii]QND87466.1 Uncharacterized protein ChrSV_0007 [Chromobacterium vaccinii]